MSQEQELKALELDHESRTKPLLRGGVLASVGWLLIAASLMVWKWHDLDDLPLNAWGDFLSGVSAPLALLWLVLGYLQQGVELRQNTQALRLQYEELRRQVRETADLAKHAGRQAEAAENLVAVNRESARQAADQLEAEYRPIFSLAGTSGGVEGPVMRIVNVGATVTGAKVISVDGLSKLSQTEVANWVTGSETSLMLGPSPTYPITLRVDFTNGLQQRRAHYHLIPTFGRFESISHAEYEQHLGG